MEWTSSNSTNYYCPLFEAFREREKQKMGRVNKKKQIKKGKKRMMKRERRGKPYLSSNVAHARKGKKKIHLIVGKIKKKHKQKKYQKNERISNRSLLLSCVRSTFARPMIRGRKKINSIFVESVAVSRRRQSKQRLVDHKDSKFQNISTTLPVCRLSNGSNNNLD